MKYAIWTVIVVLILFVGYRSCSCEGWYNNGCSIMGDE